MRTKWTKARPSLFEETGSTVLNDALAEMDDWLVRMHEREQVRSFGHPLYHYTNLGGLQGIIGNDQFRLMDFRSLKDRKEVRHGLSLTRELLRPMAAVPYSRKTYVLHRFAAGTTKSMRVRVLGRLFEFFVGCFTQHVDDLQHWTDFGQNHTGVALGVVPDWFVYNPANPKPIKPIDMVFVHPVTYGNDAIRDQLGEVIDKAKSILTRIEVYSEVTEDTHRKFFAAFNSLVASPLVWTSIMSKRKSFARENEVRLMVTGAREVFEGHVQVRPDDGRRYINVDLPFSIKPILSGVIVGSLADPNRVRQVRQFLKSKRLAPVPVVRSKVRPT